MYHVCIWCLQKPEDSMRSSKMRVTVMNCHVGAGNQTWFSTRAAYTVNCWAISSSPEIKSKKKRKENQHLISFHSKVYS